MSSQFKEESIEKNKKFSKSKNLDLYNLKCVDSKYVN